MSLRDTTTYDVAGYTLLLRLVPDEFFVRCQARAQNLSKAKWDIGDDTNELKEKVNEGLLPVPIMDIYEFMAYAHDYEISSRTVEYYSMLAAFYPVEIREEYEIFTFARFDLARRYGDLWRDVLDMMLEYMDTHNGKLPSPRWVKAVMAGVDMTESAVNNEYPDMPQVQDYEMLLDDKEGDSFNVQFVQRYIQMSKWITTELDKLPLRSDYRQRLHDTVNELLLLLNNLQEFDQLTNGE